MQKSYVTSSGKTKLMEEQKVFFYLLNLFHVYSLINPFSAGTAFMLMQTGRIQASRRITRRLAWDPTCLLLSQSFLMKNKQNLKVLRSRRQHNLFSENCPAFKGLMGIGQVKDYASSCILGKLGLGDRSFSVWFIMQCMCPQTKKI